MSCSFFDLDNVAREPLELPYSITQCEDSYWCFGDFGRADVDAEKRSSGNDYTTFRPNEFVRSYFTIVNSCTVSSMCSSKDWPVRLELLRVAPQNAAAMLRDNSECLHNQ